MLAYWRGSRGGHTVAVAAHLDTVFPEGTDLTVRQEGDRFYAPGVGDNSRGLVLMLSMMAKSVKLRVMLLSTALAGPI